MLAVVSLPLPCIQLRFAANMLLAQLLYINTCSKIYVLNATPGLLSLPELCIASKQGRNGSASKILKAPNLFVSKMGLFLLMDCFVFQTLWICSQKNRLSELCQKDGALQVLQSKGVTLIPGAFQAEWDCDGCITSSHGLEDGSVRKLEVPCNSVL